MKITVTLSNKMQKVLNEIQARKELDFTSKAEIIRKAIYVYSYLIDKHHDQKITVVGINENNPEEPIQDFSALFEV